MKLLSDFLCVLLLQNLDQETVVKAQHIVRAFLNRKKFAVVGTLIDLSAHPLLIYFLN